VTAAPRVLLAEDEPHLGTILETFLTGRGHQVTRVRDGRAALEALRAATFDVALLDVVMPELDGLAVLGALAELPLPPEAVVMTGNGTVDTALHALRLGAYDYLAKPYRMAEVDVLVRRAAEKRALRVAAAATRWARAREPQPAPESEHPPLRDALARAEGAARAGRPSLLVVGEPGTGRRTVARWLGALAQPTGVVLELRCTGDEPRDRTALFGAPSGDAAERAGALALAAGATLLLLDADRLDVTVADRLAAVLSTVVAGGAGAAPPELPPRVLVTAREEWAAGACALAMALSADGVLTLPPLRERVVDISRLAELGLPPDALPRRLHADAVAELARRAWPGNVSQLRQVVAAAAWQARDVVLGVADLRAAASGGGRASGATPPTALSLAELEHRQIAAVLEEVGWHRGRAAERLGISARTLYRKIREYGFDRRPG
jgi:two-component system response regulator AtoC